MPAHARGGPAPTGPAGWQNDARFAQIQPPTGPSNRMPAQPHIAKMPQPAATASVGAPISVPTAPAIPEPAAIPTFSHIPYFTAIQLETLYARKRGARMSASTWLNNRDIASGFIQSVASRLGFPQRTIATAQQIYQRFHLFYPPSDFVLHEIAVASLFVAAKLNDTHKKPRDLLLASYALRFPQLVKGADEPTFPTLAGQKRKHAAVGAPTSNDTSTPRPLAMAIGSVGEADIDPTILETDRKRLMALEKLIIESLCFNFHSNANTTLKMVIKLGRRSRLSKSFVRTAWKVAADLFRTSAPLQYAPNVIAVAALYGAALLARPPPRTTLPSEQTGGEEEESHDALVAFLNSIKAVSATPAPQSPDEPSPATTVPLAEPFPGCDALTHVHIEDVEESVHELLDLYLSCSAQLPPSLYMTSASGLGASHGHGTTPSPLSPADPLDVSPSSSGGDVAPASARKKLKQYEYSPPPFGLVDWLNSSRCSQLQGAVGGKPTGGSDPTAPTKELSTLLTDLKIYLRGIEYDRQRADDAYLAERNILAEVNIVPLPGSAAMEAGVQSVGMLSTPAHSVGIELRPLTGTQPAMLDEKQKVVVERIRRRKLVAALRLTFVEPEVEKRPLPHPIETISSKAVDPPPEVKRRIDAAKRYLF
uniref:Cyclin-like domain-containing protein n=1 Tax=Kalmanozyma brasiliensis (strain GHG001) TaxID=1365824 RepID=V5GS83_KALBG